MTDDEERAFTAFVQRDGDRLLRFARLVVLDDGEAEDALQTALLRLLRHWPQEAPAAWVRTTLTRLAIDRGRRRHLVAVPAEPADRGGPDPADTFVARAELDAALATLPPRQRAAVVLRVVEDLSESDVAAILGVSVGTVKSNLARGLAKVRTALPEGTPR